MFNVHAFMILILKESMIAQFDGREETFLIFLTRVWHFLVKIVEQKSCHGGYEWSSWESIQISISDPSPLILILFPCVTHKMHSLLMVKTASNWSLMTLWWHYDDNDTPVVRMRTQVTGPDWSPGTDTGAGNWEVNWGEGREPSWVLLL